MKALGALIFAAGSAFAAEPPLVLHFNDRPPLHYLTPQGELTGFVARPAMAALSAAGIPYVIRTTPAKRQLALLKANLEAGCMLSWLKAPGRERTGKFTDVVYQDKRPFALTWAGNKSMENEEPLKDSVSNPRLRLLVKDGFSYGPQIDRALARYKAQPSTTTGEAGQMLEMLYRRRADYFFITEEEMDTVLKSSGYPASAFKRIYFSDVSKGYDRHLWCTMSVPDDVIKRFNSALAKQRK
ncbi:ABC transporter substrate-binding protein [Duganella aceris]|uniref:ABC transporter substrate-binding protein n=1 Tax=Duganella aceris TaxID=2703883 RepID=A0ABX0FR52_9BURK|nr:ABC transporter substrate-binding protein [Duganella aceris]NGZ86912.1 ABC transporter substrate-binding protein [Duganella aceris]